MDTILTLHFRLEILALTLLVWLGVYFFVNRLQVEPQRRLDLAMPLDGKIPFVPQLALVYFSTYIFVIQPFHHPVRSAAILLDAGKFRVHHSDCQPDPRYCAQQDRAK